MIKLIISDLDGTLLDSHGRLPKDFDSVMEELRKRKILFVPASGRQYYTLKDMFKKYEEDFIFLAENGSYVVYKEKELYSHILDANLVEEVLQELQKLKEDNIHAVLCGKKGAYIDSRDAAFIKEVEKYYAKCDYVDSFAAIDDEFVKIALCDAVHQDAENRVYKRLTSVDDRLQLVLSGKAWVDLMPHHANKGVAVRKLLEMLHITPDECIVFGDYLNDVEMMKCAYYSYAMENAHEGVKGAARFTTLSNDEDGVLRVIRDLCHI